MSQPVYSNGWWWAQGEDGSWLRYDPYLARWVSASAPVQATYQPAYAPYPQTRTNGWAIASLVLGLLWICYLGSALAVIFGAIALHEIKNSGNVQQGRGLAIAGLSLGLVGVGFLLIGVVTGVVDTSV